MADKRSPEFEEVWQILREVGDKQRENAKLLKELAASSKDTDARFKDTDAKFKDTDAKFKATDARLDKLGKNIGGLSNKWGDLGEEMTVGEAKSVLNHIKGIKVDGVQPGMAPVYNGKEYEIDGLALGRDVVVVIEAKATLKEVDVTDFIKKLKLFTKILPIYEGKKIYGAMGFLSASDAVQTYAQEQGLILIRPTETSKELVPFPQGFKLRNFHP